ncbi:cytidylyltransferase domain-containing protein [Geobacter sp. AOG1]|uniref:acylneuraminate cytidylyltransferase family protein n=1 Tax=Geobacter sp. AOG1 TaxID=1566346 RepID=UPI001CC3E453|nr:acylneuraminate cytidylyltransferase family protein [Geobacter sp. AOG1]GFE58479.1 acylneuraminate cytidylyltransferase [Geobacter sp. AOG1]
MINRKRVLAVIPARGGSKGLPGKNIKELCGKPLIAWSIEAGRESRYIDRLVVSTDSDEIANIARSYGAEVPFKRPEYLATDTATTFAVLQHALEYYQYSRQEVFDYLVLLEPTSPLREISDIEKALEKIENNPSADSIVSIARVESCHPAFMIRMDKQNELISGFHYELKYLRRQDIEELFFLEGSIYVSKVPELLEQGTFYHQRTSGYVVPKWKSLEIDDMDDFIMVEALMKKYKGIS